MTHIDAIVNTPYPDYSWPLEIARSWIRGGDKEQKKHAAELLGKLRKKFPHALQIGQEEVLALMEGGDMAKAKAVLAELEFHFGSPDEEILSRWGRLYRDRGDLHLAPGQDGTNDIALAIDFYRQALRKYGAAYRVRNGHYPGINTATLLLLLASLLPGERDRLLADCQELVADLLSRRANWPREFPDDNIWHLGTEAETYLLQQKWQEAANRYSQAQQVPNNQPFHRDSMKRQAARILSAFRRMGVEDLGIFNDLKKVFPK
jgi:tetratricopeptide (TPR) repeat protein